MTASQQPERDDLFTPWKPDWFLAEEMSGGADEPDAAPSSCAALLHPGDDASHGDLEAESGSIPATPTRIRTDAAGEHGKREDDAFATFEAGEPGEPAPDGRGRLLPASSPPACTCSSLAPPGLTKCAAASAAACAVA